MNSLKTDILGGFPWVLDDFRWQHDATRNALNAIFKGLNIEGGNCRLQGVVGTYNGSTWDVTEGYLLVNGEIVKVDAQNGIADTDLGFDYYYVTISETFDPAGNKSLEDGGTADAYKKRRAIINSGGNFPVGADLSITMSPSSTSENNLFPTLTSIIANSNTDFSTAWGSISAATLDALAHNGLSAISGGSIRYKKVGRILFTEWNLNIEFTTATNNFEITVPSQLTPSATQQAFCEAEVGNAGGLYNKRVMVKHTIGNIFSFSVNNNEYTMSGSNATLQFSTQYRVAL